MAITRFGLGGSSSAYAGFFAKAEMAVVNATADVVVTAHADVGTITAAADVRTVTAS